MISNTSIKKRVSRKTNEDIVVAVREMQGQRAWNQVAKLLSGPTREHSSINLKKIDSETTEGDTVVVLGKVLGTGELSKKIRICAMGFSESAREKIKESKSEAVMVVDEVKKNKKAEGVKILR